MLLASPRVLEPMVVVELVCPGCIYRCRDCVKPSTDIRLVLIVKVIGALENYLEGSIHISVSEFAMQCLVLTSIAALLFQARADKWWGWRVFFSLLSNAFTTRCRILTWVMRPTELEEEGGEAVSVVSVQLPVGACVAGRQVNSTLSLALAALALPEHALTLVCDGARDIWQIAAGMPCFEGRAGNPQTPIPKPPFLHFQERVPRGSRANLQVGEWWEGIRWRKGWRRTWSGGSGAGKGSSQTSL